jgi:hypothetical protein
MGLTLDCACVRCGYKQKGIYLGSGMIMGYHYFPAYQALDKKLVHINIFRYLEIEEFRLPEETNIELTIFKSLRLIPYFERRMFSKNGSANKIICESPYLQAKANYCPKCTNFSLEFEIASLFS